MTTDSRGNGVNGLEMEIPFSFLCFCKNQGAGDELVEQPTTIVRQVAKRKVGIAFAPP